MDEMEFDKTRKAIDAKNLDKGSRRDMLDKFTSAGGKVLNEHAVNKPAPDEGKGRGGRRAGGDGGVDVKMPSELARERNRAENEKRAKMAKLLLEAEKEATSFMSRFSIKLKCRLAGLTPFGADMVTPRFMSKLNLDCKRAIMECNILANDLFSNNPKVARTLVRELDKRQPLYVEMLERASKLYSQGELSELVSVYNSSPSSPVPLDAIRAPLFSLLRKLFYLKTFQETYITAAETAISFQQQLEKKQAALYTSKRKKIVQEWKTLMNDIFPSLVLLAQRAEMKKAEPGTRLFEYMLDIVDADRLGIRKAGDPVGEIVVEVSGKKTQDESKPGEADQDGEEGSQEEGEAQNKEGETVEEEEETGSQEVRHGRALMRLTPLPQLRQKMDPTGEFKGLENNDKVFLSYLFLKEFEDEYSFILTTQKLKLNPNYVGGAKTDYRQQMADLFETVRPCHDGFKNYVHETGEHKRALEEANGQSKNYVAHAKRISLMENRRGASGREVRVNIKEFMEKVGSVLGTLIEDIRGSGQVVMNRDDVITFDPKIEGNKRLNGKPIKECIMEAYCYAHALAERIDSGDLFGGVIEMTAEEFERSFGDRAKPEVDPLGMDVS